MTAPLILVDGSSYLYRAFHAMFKADLRNSQGEPTGAIRTVTSMLRRLQKDYPDSVVAVIFDAKGKTFRDDIFPEYKANRPSMPDDLKSQVEPVHQIIRNMGLSLLVVDGVEADDVIGTLAHQATQQGMNVIVSTGDKDMAQLVNEHVMLVNTMTETMMDVAGVEDKFGIPPALIIDFLALTGDKVDNIPGVPGVGEKTALALLRNIGGIEAIYQNLESIRELDFRGAKTIHKKLEEHEEMVRLSYTLATIKTDVALGLGPKDLVQEEENVEALRELYERYEFKPWLQELNGNDLEKASSPIDYDTVLTEGALQQWINHLEQAELFAFDTETTSLDYMEARVVGVSFAVESGKAAYVPCGHDYLDAPEQLSLDYVLEKLKPLLENPNKAKVGQNLKYDRNVLLNHEVELQGIAFDTMLESYIYHSTATRHDMDSLACFYLDKSTIHFEDIAGKGAKQLTFNQIPLEQAAPYAAEDADITLQLHQTLWPKLQQKASLGNVFRSIELPLIPVISRMERQGALIDAALLGEHSLELDNRLNILQKTAFDLAGEAFNLSSPKQLGAILFEKLALPVIKKTPKGAPSTAEEVLQELALDYPLPKVLIEYRSLAKLKSTYTDKLPQMIKPQTGRIHTSYHQAVTATGRLSSSDPNLQNIPIRNPEGRRIRQAFIAPDGYQIVAADYSQIELRIMAHLSGDKGLTEAFNHGLDVHRATAAEVFDVALDHVTDEQRRSAKAINFGLIYGMSAFGLGKQLGLGRNDAQQYIDLYFERYPGVKDYMDCIRQQAAKQGYVETLMGRRLYLPDISANNNVRKQATERTAINAPMQGTAADIIKTAMIRVDQWLMAEKVNACMIMQVHDELVLEVKTSDTMRVSQQLAKIMSEAVTLSVPLVVDVGFGDNWDQAH
ncbi:DNA polymerase I [Candidatus Endobugula sertula]|uniref:DNA polymerase I n=1 Tax=Candidatus Endobugula sertula TaxID=62101 RepID=A0A1D2QR18_9GAMM|nr:DNA polymerase I [Candidatus Endobugula sertula]